MKQILKKQGWLVMAAALTIGLSGCSNDEIASIEKQQAISPKAFSITIGAGFNADASTRSAVVYNETAMTRTLTFTKGDRLFVQGYLGERHLDDEIGWSYYDYKVAGLLSMVEGSLSEDGKSAKFTGELYLLTPQKVQEESYSWYNYVKNANATYDFEGQDPLSLTTDTEAYLVHEDAVEDEDVYIGDDNISYYTGWAADVNTLMTTKMYIGGYGYDAENKSFSLESYSGPVFNFTVSGLKPNASYQMFYCYTTSWNETSMEEYLPNTITANASGIATFALFAMTYYSTHGFKFVPVEDDGSMNYEGGVMVVDLGALELENGLVYNVNRTAVSDGGNISNGIETPGDGGLW